MRLHVNRGVAVKRVSAVLDESVAECYRYGFGFRVDLQLAVDTSKMKIDGMDAYTQFGSRSLIVVSSR